MLLEVLVSALLVALIAVGTYSGLASSGSATAHERLTAQATSIAQQDEERLHGLSTTQLEELGEQHYSVAENGMCLEQKLGIWYYWASSETPWTTGCEAVTGFKGTKYIGNVFTVKSSREYVDAAKESLTCETEKGTADYIQTTSSVTWSSVGSHKPVSQSSLIDEPTSTTLVVKVKNRNNEPVSGAAVAAYDPKTALAPTAIETTPSSGCVIFGGLAEGEVRVVAAHGEWVEQEGKPSPEKPIKVTTGKLAETEFTLEEPGGLTATFVNGSRPVSSFTFVAFHPEIPSPSFFVGGEASTAAATATLTKLFPFALPVNKPDKYTAYAGDCAANNPTTVAGIAAPTAQLEPNRIEAVKVEVPEVKLTVYEGTSSSSTKERLTSTSAKVINSECKSTNSQNSSPVPTEHEDPIVSGSLKYPYLPYAKKLELCVEGNVEGSSYQYKNSTYTNSSQSGTTWPTIYLKGVGTKVSSTTHC
jgi:hypothetical protein